MNKMKYGDYIVIFLIICISFSMYFLTTRKTNNIKNKAVQITINGQVYQTIDLNNNTKTIYINSEFGHNVIKLDKGIVFMFESDCNDQICVKMGKIKDVGDNIICLPNRLLVKIISNDDENSDEMDMILK